MLAKCCLSEPGFSQEAVEVSEIPFLIMPMHLCCYADACKGDNLLHAHLPQGPGPRFGAWAEVLGVGMVHQTVETGPSPRDRPASSVPIMDMWLVPPLIQRMDHPRNLAPAFGCVSL